MTPNASAKQFPDLRAVTSSNSYADPICTPLRVMVKMIDGPNCGLYQIVKTRTELGAGSEVLIDQITGYAELAKPDGGGAF